MGAFLFYAVCTKSIGSTSFERALSMEREVFLKSAIEDYHINNQTAVSMIGMVGRCRVAAVSDLDDHAIRAAGMERCENPEAFLAEALEETGEDRIAVVPYGAQTLPYVERGRPQ